jgi:1-acyl-sn-glycerol-3-phosphate acyltransferase
VSFRAYRRLRPDLSAWSIFFWWIIVRTVVRVAMWLVYRQRCLQRSRIPQSGPALYVSNHQSHLDPPIVGCLTGPLACLARADLLQVPFWGPVMRQIGAIPIQRERGDAEAMRAAIDVLQAGGRMLLFPEGTRTRDGAIGAFRPGLLVLLKRTGAPVVPIAIEGAFDVWPPGRRRPRLRGRIAVIAGAPIPAAELLALPREEALEHLKKTIDGLRLELRRRLGMARTVRAT